MGLWSEFTGLEKCFALITGLILLVVLGVGMAQPYFEMQTFNKFSKTKATYWDALVSELRVIPN